MKKIIPALIFLIGLVLLSGCPSEGIPAECSRDECNTNPNDLLDCSMTCNKKCFSMDMYVPRILRKDVTEDSITCYCACETGSGDQQLIARAYNQDDIAICDQLRQERGPNSQEECRMIVARKRMDVSICETIIDQAGGYSKHHCYILVAVESRNAGLCELILEETGEYSKDYCYAVVAEVARDDSLCERIRVSNGENSKDMCYFFVAAEKQDKSICEKITGDEDGYNKENCYGWIYEGLS